MEKGRREWKNDGASLASTCSLALLLAIVGLIFRELLDPDRTPLYRDVLFFVLPFKQLLAERICRGEIPLWNPWVYMGTPFLASLQSGVFYLPSLILCVPFPLGLNLFFLFHFTVAASGMWLLLRYRGLSLASAIVGAMTFTLGGYLVSMLNVTNHLQGGAWVPWLLVASMRFRDRPSLPIWSGLTAMLALALLAGAPESLLLALAVASAWMAWTTPSNWRRSLVGVLGLLAALIAAGGLTAFQILPTAEYIAQSARSDSLPYAEVTTWSLQPVSLLQLLFPHSPALDPATRLKSVGPMFEAFEPWIYSIYLGMVPLCLLVAGLARGRDRCFWGVIGAVGLVLALGRFTPVFAFFYELLPTVFGKFRFPEKFFLLVHLAASVCAAEGAEAIHRKDSPGVRLAVITASTLASLAIVLVAVRYTRLDLYLLTIAGLSGRWQRMTSFVPLADATLLKAQRLVVVLGVFLALFVLRRNKLLRPELFTAAVVLLIAADFASAQYGLNLTTSWTELATKAPLVDVHELRRTHQRIFLYQTTSDELPGTEPKPIPGLEILGRPQLRTDSLEEMIQHLWRALFMDAAMMRHVESLSGADGITRSSDNMLRNALEIMPRDRGLKILRTFSVEYLIGLVPLDGFELAHVETGSGSPFWVYRLPNPVPKAYLAGRLSLAATELDAFNRLIAADFRPGLDATVPELPPQWTDLPGAGEEPVGQVLSVAYHEGERVEIRADTVRQALLVFNDSHFPGWEARLDGAPAEILRTNGLVRGVVVPQGAHRVEFIYRPRSFRLGVTISLVTAGVLAAGMVSLSRRGRSAVANRHASR